MENNFLDAYLTAFSNLSYLPSDDKINIDDFLKAGAKALRLSPDMDEAVIAAKMIFICLFDWKRVEEAFESNKKLFLDNREEKPLYLHPLSEKDAKGTTWVTNATRGTLKAVDLTSKEGLLTSQNRNGYYPSASGSYRLEYDRENKNRMKILDENFEPLCDIVMNDECEIWLENNKTPYCLLGDDGIYLNIYPRSYIESLKGERPKRKDRVAEILWALTNDAAPYLGVARLKVFGEDSELFALMAMSTFLLYERYMDEDYKEDVSAA